MTVLLTGNNETLTIVSTITNSATSVQVSSGTSANLPAISAGQAIVATHYNSTTQANDEIVWITNVNTSTDTLTIVRGKEGTTPVAWTTNDWLALNITAGMLNNYVQPNQAQARYYEYADDTGSSGAAYVITLPVAPIAYTDGMVIGFSTPNANTSLTPTINANGLGAVTLTAPGGVTIYPGLLQANTVYYAAYNSSKNSFEIQNLTPLTVKLSNGNYRLNVDGTIEQWGVVPITNASTGASFSFPTPFTSAAPVITAGDGSNACLSYGFGSKTKNGATVFARDPAAAGALTTGAVMYYAIGF